MIGQENTYIFVSLSIIVAIIIPRSSLNIDFATMTMFKLKKCFGKRKHQTICEVAVVPSSPEPHSADDSREASNDITDTSEQECDDDQCDQAIHLSTTSSTDASTIDTLPDEENDARTSDCERKPAALSANSSPLLMIGSDSMVNVVSYLDPRETLNLLTMPLCKQWRLSYTCDQELWRTICLTEPFSADIPSYSASNSSDGSTPRIISCYDDIDNDSSSPLENNMDNVFGEFRLIFTSFVRCMNYLDRVQNINGGGGRKLWSERSHNRGSSHSFPTFGVTDSLKKFLIKRKEYNQLRSVIGNGKGAMSSIPIGISSDGQEIQPSSKTETKVKDLEKPKYGNSMITSRLFSSHLNLPKSFAIYSIVNWMVAHPNVKGIQIMCIQALPSLLEDEQQRVTGQRVGLVEVILSAMMRFPECVELHIAVFHSIVLLARPLGGREGMLFDNSMADSTQSIGLTSRIELADSVSLASRCGGLPSLERKNRGSNTPRSTGLANHRCINVSGTTGVSLLVDSMQRFSSCEKLQSMACWALVNVALVPAQKNMFLRIGGIEAILNAMEMHEKVFDVQFRALFALINLVVPCRPSDFAIDRSMNGMEATRLEKAVLTEFGPKIAQLSVTAMKNFCSSETILNRGCLVVHNLSQSPAFMSTLLETPHCFQILEWCVTNHSTDSVLRRSVSSTIARMQNYLDEHPEQQERFAVSLEQQNHEVLDLLW